jgi:hypothetical protein
MWTKTVRIHVCKRTKSSTNSCDPLAREALCRGALLSAPLLCGTPYLSSAPLHEVIHREATRLTGDVARTGVRVARRRALMRSPDPLGALHN